MDKMKEFLLKNKGCPMTPAATKQLLVKFIEWLQKQGLGNFGDKISVNDSGDLVIAGGLTSKGIANTGALANIGDIEATGTIDGKLKQGPTLTVNDGVPITKSFEVSRKIGDICLYQCKLSTTGNMNAQDTIGTFEYSPSSSIFLCGVSVGGSIKVFEIQSIGELKTVQSLLPGYDYTIFAIIQIQ